MLCPIEMTVLETIFLRRSLILYARWWRRVRRILAVGILVVCSSSMNVHRASDRRNRGVDFRARSIWWVYFAAWLKILQTGQNREQPMMVPRHICADAYRLHRLCSYGRECYIVLSVHYIAEPKVHSVHIALFTYANFQSPKKIPLLQKTLLTYSI